MTLKRTDEPVGSPWQRPLNGRFDQLVVESEVLASNPLGDPSRRPLYVYSSPTVATGEAADAACVYVLQGFGGQLDAWFARKSFEPTMVERLDPILSEPDCPAAVVVFVDAWTSLGGAQFLNSSATGNYTDYLCEEVVPFIDANYPTAGTRDMRAVTGHSSGGYGALVLPMLRPKVFGALVAHAPDSLFEYCYMPDFAKTVRVVRDAYDGSYDALLADVAAAETFDWERWPAPINAYGMAAAYSPDPDRPGQVLLPFDVTTGRLIDEVWRRWLEHDPVRMASHHAEALGALHHIHLEAGRSDEFMLDVGTVAFSSELDALGIEHTLELFAGRHGGITHRFGPAIRTLLSAL